MMSANSSITPWAADMLPDSPPSRVEAVRRLLASYLTRDSKHCAEAVRVLDVEWLRRQGLASLTWHTCNGPAGVSPDISQQLQHLYYSAVGDAELHRRELHTVLRSLQAEGIWPVVFKGAALSWTVYPDPACRPMGDLDLWIRSDELLQAQKTMRDLGYRQVTNPDRPPALMEQFGGEIHMSGTGEGNGLVELHLRIFPGEWLRHTTSISESSVRERVVRSRWNETPLDVLAPEDALIHLMTHLAINHQLSFFTMRSLVDVTLLVKHYDINWNVIVQRARTWRVATVGWLVLSLATDLAGLGEAAEAARRLQPPILRQWVIGRFANAESLVMMRDLSASKWRYVFLLLLVDRGRDALRLIFRALWPEREWLNARYGHYSLATRLRHLRDAARGRI